LRQPKGRAREYSAEGAASFASDLPIPENLSHTESMRNNLFESATSGARIGLVLLVWVVWGQLAVAGGDRLFVDDEVLDVTLRAPFTSLMRQEKSAPDVAGSLELGDGTAIPVTYNKYGISRLRECQLASLVITVDTGDVEGTPFEGLHVLRLVTPCRLRGDYDKYITLEYLVYRSYAVLAEPALGVRLARVQFQDIEKPTKERTGYAFFIEDIVRAAARSGQMWLDIQWQGLDDVDAAQLTLMTLFQYMVGNTDWSAVRSRPDERCCHNVAVLGQEGGDVNTLLPFDFDQVGLVNPPYAAPPDPSVGIRRVTDRKFRGLCEHNAELAGAIAVFNERRSDLERLFQDERLPYPKSRDDAWKYIEDFYDTINDPQKLEKRILNECR